jgi:hypothetical protein
MYKKIYENVKINFVKTGQLLCFCKMYEFCTVSML